MAIHDTLKGDFAEFVLAAGKIGNHAQNLEAFPQLLVALVPSGVEVQDVADQVESGGDATVGEMGLDEKQLKAGQIGESVFVGERADAILQGDVAVIRCVAAKDEHGALVGGKLGDDCVDECIAPGLVNLAAEEGELADVWSVVVWL